MKFSREGIFFGQRTGLDRLYGLTDGTYAIVLTLLALELKVPEVPGLTEAQLVGDLAGQITDFIAYLISFYAIAIFWMRNHWVLKPIKECDEGTFLLQFLHLFFISLTPYTSSLVGRYEEDPIAPILFSGSFGLAGLSLLFLHRYLVPRKEWHDANVTEEWTKPRWMAVYPGPLFALISVPLSFMSVTLTLLLWLLLPVFSVLLQRR